MKKIILLLFFAIVLFFIYNRQKLFLRDPLGSVQRDGVKEEGAQVYINYSNEVLLQNEKAAPYSLVVQLGNHIGAPAELKCIRWMICLGDHDPVSLVDPMGQQPDRKVVQMTNRLVEFRDEAGRNVQVKLR